MKVWKNLVWVTPRKSMFPLFQRAIAQITKNKVDLTSMLMTKNGLECLMQTCSTLVCIQTLEWFVLWECDSLILLEGICCHSQWPQMNGQGAFATIAKNNKTSPLLLQEVVFTYTCVGAFWRQTKWPHRFFQHAVTNLWSMMPSRLI